jgi:hypothetical protein
MQTIPPAILAEEILHRGNVPHQNRLDFFATFCIKAKSRTALSKLR